MNNLIDLTRRELLAGAGAGAAALLLNQRGAEAQPSAGRTVVFANTTVVTVDAVRDEVSLAVTGDTIVAIGPTDQVLKSHPNAEIYNGRGKALFPGLINCHAHLAQTLGRGFHDLELADNRLAAAGNFQQPFAFCRDHFGEGAETRD